jgi:restriction system protein
MLAISEFATYINPLIFALKKSGGSARADEVSRAIAETLHLPDTVLDKQLKNGESRFKNQVHWVRFYLANAGYLDSSKRGVWTLTEKGLITPELDEDQLRKIIQEVQAKTVKTKPDKVLSQLNRIGDNSDALLPDATAASSREQLLKILKSLSPSGFERICQRLLREAGFEKVEVTGRSGDGGIDGNGVLQINPFVSFQVLFQCKRYEGNVTASQVRDFRGAMMGRAEKGIILTTGRFTADAEREASRDGVQPIELVDGDKLVSMFEQLELGMKPRTVYEVDEAFFEPFKR